MDVKYLGMKRRNLVTRKSFIWLEARTFAYQID